MDAEKTCADESTRMVDGSLQPIFSSTPLVDVKGTQRLHEIDSTNRPSSALNGIHQNRLEEKTELQSLNDRLAGYIDRMRKLVNTQLKGFMETFDERVEHQTADLKRLYEVKLSDTRKLLKQEALANAKLKFESTHLLEMNVELKEKYEKMCNIARTSEDAASLYESKYKEIQNSYNATLAELKKSRDDAENSILKTKELCEKLDNSKKLLTETVLTRVGLEGELRCLRKDCDLKDKLHAQELKETKAHCQMQSVEGNCHLTEQYKSDFKQSLQEVRKESIDQILSNRIEIESLLEKYQLECNTKSVKTALDDLSFRCSRVDWSDDARIVELQKANAFLCAQIHDLESLVDKQKARTVEMDEEIILLREEMSQLLDKYKDLMDTKVSLDLELSTYDKLLRMEERRLNMELPPAKRVLIENSNESKCTMM